MPQAFCYDFDVDSSTVVLPPLAAGPGLVAICLLTTNERENTLACLESLEAAGHPKPGYAVVLADNGSADGTMETVAARYPWVIRILNGRNLGFAAGNNTSLRWALGSGFRYVMLLNNDTVVPQGAIELLFDAMEGHPELGLAGPLLLSHADPSRIDSAGIDLSSVPGATDRLMGRPAGDAPPETERVFGLTGAGAFFRGDALRAAGLLDEDFYLLLEDVDLDFRVRLLGYDAALVPASRIYHKRGLSSACVVSAEKEFLLLKNSAALALRYWPAGHILTYFPLVVKGWLQSGVTALRTGRWSNWRRVMKRSRALRRAQRENPEWRRVQREWMPPAAWGYYLRRFRRLPRGGRA